MEYSVVESESLIELVKEVRQKVSEGWIVQGGVSVETIPVEQEVDHDYQEGEPEAEGQYLEPQGASSQEDESSHPVYLNADLAVPVDWQLTGDADDDSNFEDEDSAEYEDEAASNAGAVYVFIAS